MVDNNYDDNGILAGITLPTADGIKCDYHVPLFAWQIVTLPVQLPMLSLVM